MYCNTTEPLQYNSFPTLQYNQATSLPAIQFCVLQYNFLAYQPSPAIQFSKLYCNTISLVTRLQYTSILQYNPAHPSCLSYNTMTNITTHFQPLKPSSLQYKNCIAIQFSSPTQLAIHFILQYKTHLTCNTIIFLQYNWAVAHFKFLHQFLFYFNFSFFHYKYIYFFSYFQQLENFKKYIYTHFFSLSIFPHFQQLEKFTKITKNNFFFLFFNTQINLQKFIFFIFLQFYTI